jgi:uncharacterized YkwD family protein/spore coat assembly protein SafA
MKKIKIYLLISSYVALLFSFTIFAQSATYNVVSGDTLWKISLKYKMGLNELIALNPQISNPNLIYPNQKINVPSSGNQTNPDRTTAPGTTTNIENKVVQLVNIERSKNGLPPLKANEKLANVARLKSQDMLNKGYFSHTSPTYGSPFKMMEDFGIRYSAAGENIAMGQPTAEQVMNAWMNSPGHRSNILSRSFSEIGVGYVSGGSGRNYWTQMFIRPL